MNVAAPVRTAAAVAAAALLFAVFAAPVLAHAALVTSDPAAGAVLASSPTTITLTFDDDLDGTKSNFVLAGPTASSVTGAVTPDNLKVMTATGVALGPGAWTIQWTAFSTDGHLTRGTVNFTISAATPAPTATVAPSASAAAATAAPTPAPTTAPTAAPSATAGTDSGASDSGSVIIAVVAGLAFVAGAAWWLVRRNRG